MKKTKLVHIEHHRDPSQTSLCGLTDFPPENENGIEHRYLDKDGYEWIFYARYCPTNDAFISTFGMGATQRETWAKINDSIVCPECSFIWKLTS